MDLAQTLDGSLRENDIAEMEWDGVGRGGGG